MKVIIQGYSAAGVGPTNDIVLERGHHRDYVRIILPEGATNVAGRDLWRAVKALMADPEMHGLRKSQFDI